MSRFSNRLLVLSMLLAIAMAGCRSVSGLPFASNRNRSQAPTVVPESISTPPLANGANQTVATSDA